MLIGGGVLWELKYMSVCDVRCCTQEPGVPNKPQVPAAAVLLPVPVAGAGPAGLLLPAHHDHPPPDRRLSPQTLTGYYTEQIFSSSPRDPKCPAAIIHYKMCC